VRNQAQMHADLGPALLGMGYTKSAEAEFRRELALDPQCPLARFGLGELTLLRGNWQEATVALEELTRAQPRELKRFLESPSPGTIRQAWKEGKIHMPEGFASSPTGTVWKAWLDGSETIAVAVARISQESIPACTRVEATVVTTPGLWLTESCYERLTKRLSAKKLISLPEMTKLAEAQ